MGQGEEAPGGFEEGEGCLPQGVVAGRAFRKFAWSR